MFSVFSARENHFRRLYSLVEYVTKEDVSTFQKAVRWTPSVGQESGRLKRESRRSSKTPPDPRGCLGVSIDPTIHKSIHIYLLFLSMRLWACGQRGSAA